MGYAQLLFNKNYRLQLGANFSWKNKRWKCNQQTDIGKLNFQLKELFIKIHKRKKKMFHVFIYLFIVSIYNVNKARGPG